MKDSTLIAGVRQKTGVVMRVLRTSWALRPQVIVGYFIGAALEIAGTITTIYASAQIGNLLARYISGHSTGRIWLWVIVDVIAAIVIGIGFWIMSYCQRMLYYSMVSWSTTAYMRKLYELDIPDHFDQTVRNQINKAENGFSWQMAALSNMCLELCYGILRFLVITIVVAQITWWLVPVIILFLLPSLVAEAKLAQLVWFVWDEQGDQRQVFWGLFWVFKQARAQMEIRSSQAGNYLTRKIEQMNHSFYRAQEDKYRQASKGVVASKVLEAGGIAVGTIVLIKRFLAGTIGFDRYLFLSGALLRVGGALNAVFGTVTRLQEPLLYAQNFYELADRPVRMIDKPNAKMLKNIESPDIVFENVSFSYPGSGNLILENLNLHIKPGEHLAMVGENGAGKSTLIKLLLRFYAPTSGRILIDGVDLNDVEIDSWYGRLATLFQEFNRYPFSIKESIALERDASEQKLKEAVQQGGVAEIAKDLPYGLETILDSSFTNGIEPSGGEYQRVALARAFYRNANLLILDEPTAAIDAKAEYKIFNNIFKEYKDKSAIIVSHRFSTVRRADRIVVLDQGKIIEHGSHAQLIKKKGLYHEMFSKQAEGYR